MSSRLMRGMVICGACLGTALSVAWAAGPSTARPIPTYGQNPAVSSVAPDTPLVLPFHPGDQKPSKSARIMFESTWKNVQVGAKPLSFRQGNKAFVWTVKNTGENPVDVGDDYGFSIAPGEEDFIVDTRLMLSVANDKATTVEVKAARVMTQSELSSEASPAPAMVPTYAPPPSSITQPVPRREM